MKSIDKWGGLALILAALLFLASCSNVRRNQIEKDMNIVDFKLSELRHQVVAPLDKTFVDKARWEIRKKLNDQNDD